jgi:hypothetical protein
MEQLEPKQKADQIINDLFKITQRYSEIEKLAFFVVNQVLNAVDVGNDITMKYADYWVNVRFELKKAFKQYIENEPK